MRKNSQCLKQEQEFLELGCCIIVRSRHQRSGDWTDYFSASSENLAWPWGVRPPGRFLISDSKCQRPETLFGFSRRANAMCHAPNDTIGHCLDLITDEVAIPFLNWPPFKEPLCLTAAYRVMYLVRWNNWDLSSFVWYAREDPLVIAWQLAAPVVSGHGQCRIFEIASFFALTAGIT